MTGCLSYVVFAVVDGVIDLFIYYSLQHICMIYEAEPPSLFGNCIVRNRSESKRMKGDQLLGCIRVLFHEAAACVRLDAG